MLRPIGIFSSHYLSLPYAAMLKVGHNECYDWKSQLIAHEYSYTVNETKTELYIGVISCICATEWASRQVRLSKEEEQKFRGKIHILFGLNFYIEIPQRKIRYYLWGLTITKSGTRSKSFKSCQIESILFNAVLLKA